MGVEWGMPTLIEYRSIEDNLMLCKELGLDFVELNMNLPEYQPDRVDAAQTKGLFQCYGVYPTIHLDENLNPCDFNTAVADAYVDTARKAVELARAIDAPIVNMHMANGVSFALPEGSAYLFERYKQHYRDGLLRFRDVCATTIGESGIRVCVENCGTYHGFQREGIDLLLEAPCFALTYDIGHDRQAGFGNRAFIMSRAERLAHMHIHDATDTRVHLPPGAGDIDITAMMALAARHKCRCVLELKTADALRQSAAFMRRMASSV